MQAWLIGALLVLASHVGAGFYWHHNGYSEAQRDAQAHEADAVVAAIEAANELSAADSKRAIEAERKRGEQRQASTERTSALAESIRTEVVYRDRDCVLPDADRLRINAAYAAARATDSSPASRGDGPVPRARRPPDGDAVGPGGETARDGGRAGGMPDEARRAD